MNGFARVLIATLLVTLLAGAAVAGGSSEEPLSVDIPRDATTAFSPNGDGVQDVARFTPEITIDPARVIKRITVEVYSATAPNVGTLVWRYALEELGERGAFGDLFGIGEEPSITLPDDLAWDGQFIGSELGQDGTDAPDGAYIYQIAIADDRGAEARTPPITVTVDRVAPSLSEPAADRRIFSPNGDGIADTVTITQTGSVEAAWSSRIESADGEVVAETQLSNVAPVPYVWDGRDIAGRLAPDGTYTYVITGQDAAGNATTSAPLALVLSTASGDVVLAPAEASISPNGDDSQDSIDLAATATNEQDIVSWSFVLRAGEPSGPVVYETAATGMLPGSLTVAGVANVGSAAASETLPDGEYQAVLQVEYSNGSISRSVPSVIVVDTAAPTGSLLIETAPTALEPDIPARFGGTGRASLLLTATLDPEEWIATLGVGDTQFLIPLTDDMAPVTQMLGGGVRVDLIWDGSEIAGQQVPDGLLTLQLSAIDAAGNIGLTNEVRIIKDTRPASANLVASELTISPDNDGILDSSVLSTDYAPADGIAEFLLSILTEDGRILRTEYKRNPFDSFEWLGRMNSGATVPDGEYSARLEVIYANGNIATADAGPITVDNTHPRVLELSAPFRLFSPDGDGERDLVTISQSGTPEEEWIGTISTVDGEEVLVRRWQGEPDGFDWDGTDSNGDLVPDGEYTYLISATDSGGNVGLADLTLIIDTRSLPVSQQPPVVSISASPRPFTPDGDGLDDTVTLEPSVSSGNEIARWLLELRGPFGELLRTFRGTGAPEALIVWDGRSSRGELVQSAQEYTAELTVTDSRGNIGSAETTVAVGILVMREGLLLRIMIPSISFAPYTADLFAISDLELERNLVTLRNLAEVLKRYPEREILIEGHAAHDNWREGPEKEREQREELVPLSAARAEEVRQALIILGIEPDRMRTVGVGGARPVVPHSDRENIWKNRRVEFILERR